VRRDAGRFTDAGALRQEIGWRDGDAESGFANGILTKSGVSGDVGIRRQGQVPNSFEPAVGVAATARADRASHAVLGLGRRLAPQLLRRWRRRRLGHSIIILSAVLIVGSMLNTLLALEHSYTQVVDAAATNLAAMSRAAALETDRELFDVDRMLVRLGRALGARHAGTALDDPSVGVLLRDFSRQTPAVQNLLLVDATGKVLNAADSGRAARHLDLAAGQGSDSGGLSIGRPQPGPAGAGWSIPLRRPMTRDGTAIGYAVAEVKADFLADVFASFGGDDPGHTALLLGDGTLAAVEPAWPGAVGTRPAFAVVLLSAAAQRPAGVLPAVPAPGDRTEMRSWSKLPAWPLIVTVARDRSDILRSWHGQCTASIAAFLLFALTAGGLTALSVRALQRQQVAMLRHRRAEQRLKRQSTLLQDTLENLGEGLSVFNRNGRLVAWNSRFGEMLDLPPDMIGGKTLREILLFQARRGDFGEVEVEAEAAARLDAFYRELPTVRERTNGGGRVLRIRRRGMPGSGDIVSVYSDVTEMRNFERQIVQACTQSELANRAKSEFLANMSHELRTPLNAIIGFSEIISNQIFGPIKNPKYLEYMGDIHSSSLHLLAIINDILDMSKIEAGCLELAKEALSAQQAIAEAMRMMHERAQERGVELIAEFPPADTVIWADARAIKQILINLLSNAIKFSREGGEVRVRLAVDQSRSAVIDVADTGIGMTEEEVERALQPFGQAKPVTTREYGGTGLGLPITKGLVEAHGGTLTITTRPACGTTVHVALPLPPVNLVAELGADRLPISAGLA
jgi:signal transduction histidine kinase